MRNSSPQQLSARIASVRGSKLACWPVFPPLRASLGSPALPLMAITWLISPDHELNWPLKRFASPRLPRPILKHRLRPGDGLSISIREAGSRSADRSSEEHADPGIEIRIEDRNATPVSCSWSCRLATGWWCAAKTATFVGYTNYSALVGSFRNPPVRSRVQHRIPFRSPSLPSMRMGFARWQAMPLRRRICSTFFRVYGADEKFDETSAQELTILDAHRAAMRRLRVPSFGTQDEAAIRTISQSRTSTITVTGRADPETGYRARRRQRRAGHRRWTFRQRTDHAAATRTRFSITIGQGDEHSLRRPSRYRWRQRWLVRCRPGRSHHRHVHSLAVLQNRSAAAALPKAITPLAARHSTPTARWAATGK